MSHAPSQPPRETIEPDELADYDRVVGRFRASRTIAEADDHRRFAELGEQSEVGVFFGALLNCPPLAAGISDLGRYYRGSSLRFSPAERQWIVEVVGLETGCLREVLSHLDEAVRLGVRPAALAALLRGCDGELEPDERELTDYVRAVLRGTVAKGAFRAMEARFGARGVVEVTAFASHILMASRLMQALGADHVTAEQVEAELERILTS